MFKNFSLGLFFAMAAVTVVVFTPFIMIFHPIFHAFFLENTAAAIFVPNPVNGRLVLLAGALFVGMLGILAYKRNKNMYMVGGLLLVLGVGTAYLSTQNYLKIDDEQIARQYMFDARSYEWDDLSEIVYEYVVGSRAGDFTLTAKTGEQLVISEKELHSTAISQIYNLARQNDVSYIEREK